MIVVSDTTPIIAMAKANRLELLRSLFDKVIIPEGVYAELTAKPEQVDEAALIESCIFIERQLARRCMKVLSTS